MRLSRFFTADRCTHSSSVRSRSRIRARRSSSASAVTVGSSAFLRRREPLAVVLVAVASVFFCAAAGGVTPGSESYASNWSHAAASDLAVEPATPTPTTNRPRRLHRWASGT